MNAFDEEVTRQIKTLHEQWLQDNLLSSEVCGFCGDHPASPGYTVRVELHGIPRLHDDTASHANMNEGQEGVDRKRVNILETSDGEYEWDVLSLAIPRCKICGACYRGMAMVGLTLGSFMACTYLGGYIAHGLGVSEKNDMLIGLLAFGTPVCILVASITAVRFRLVGARAIPTDENVARMAIVKQYLETGWRLGSRPKDDELKALTKTTADQFALAALRHPMYTHTTLGQIPQLWEQIAKEFQQIFPEMEGKQITEEIDKGMEIACVNCGEFSRDSIAKMISASLISKLNPQATLSFGGPNIASMVGGRCPNCRGENVIMSFDPRPLRRSCQNAR